MEVEEDEAEEKDEQEDEQEVDEEEDEQLLTESERGREKEEEFSARRDFKAVR